MTTIMAVTLVGATCLGLSVGFVSLDARLSSWRRAIRIGSFTVLLFALAQLLPLTYTALSVIDYDFAVVSIVILAVLIFIVQGFPDRGRWGRAESLAGYLPVVIYTLSLFSIVRFLETLHDLSDPLTAVLVAAAAVGFSSVILVIRRMYVREAFDAHERLSTTSVFGLMAFGLGGLLPYALVIWRVAHLTGVLGGAAANMPWLPLYVLLVAVICSVSPVLAAAQTTDGDGLQIRNLTFAALAFALVVIIVALTWTSVKYSAYATVSVG